MKKIFTLIAACVFSVMSAKAQTVYYSMDYEADGVEADWTSGNTGRYTVSIKGDASNHYLAVDAVGNGNNGTTITCDATNSKVAANTDFFMSFDLGLFGGNNQASSFYVYDSSNSKAILEITQNTAGNYTAWTANGTKAVNFSAKGAKCTYKLAIKNGTVYFTLIDGANTKIDKEIIATEVSGLGKMVFNTKRYYSGMTIDNVLVRSLEEGDTPAAQPFEYKISAVDEDGNLIKVLSEGTSTDAITYCNPIIINEGGNYYIANNKSSFANVVSDENKEVNITYSMNNNIVAYAEAESAPGSSASYSNGGVAFVAAQNYTNRGLWLGTLTPGTYEMVTNVAANGFRGTYLRNQNSTDETTNTIAFTESTGAITIPFTILNSTPVVVNGKNSGAKSNQSSDFDYVYIVKTGDATVNIEVNDNGTASYVAPCNLDFEGSDLKAYVATAVSETTITLAEVTKVAAGEAIVVKGESCNVNVIAEADAPATNLFKAGAYTVEAGDNIFALSKNDGKFHKVAEGVTIPEGKAYIALPATESKAISLNFDGDVTGIKTTTAAKQNTNAYNLFGQKVSANAKGIVIINGKKINNK